MEDIQGTRTGHQLTCISHVLLLDNLCAIWNKICQSTVKQEKLSNFRTKQNSHERFCELLDRGALGHSKNATFPSIHEFFMHANITIMQKFHARKLPVPQICDFFMSRKIPVLQ